MKGSRRTIVVLLTLAVLVALVVPTFASGQAEGDGEEAPYVAVISKGFQHDFWQQVRIGAENAAEEFGVDMTFE